MRDECLNEHLFFSMNHARAIVAGWVEDFNTARPHSAIGYMTPAAYAATLKPQRAPALRHLECSAPPPVATVAPRRKCSPPDSSDPWMNKGGHVSRDTAVTWLKQHFPEDVDRHLERIVPHSELWFSIVDRVEPKLGAIARISMSRERSSEVCSSCGDPARDYRLVNGAETMPGVPSLRLCNDCVGIRREGGEMLEPLS